MRNSMRCFVSMLLTAALATGVPLFAPMAQAQEQTKAATPPQANGAKTLPLVNYPSLLDVRNYSKGKSAFPNIFAPYTSQSIARPNLENAPTIYSLIQDGKLNLSLPDAIALALENNLDIAVSEYTPWIDETQILQAEGGGTPLGQFVIGGGGGGVFDPVIAVNSSVSDTSRTVNNPLTSGVGTSAGALTQSMHDTQINLSYTQELHSGTTFNILLNNDRNSTSPSANIFNPAITSSLIVAIEQPLLNGWGFLPHTRFILEAKNTSAIGKLQFEEQVIASITQVETQYWILVADRQAVDVANETIAAYQKFYDADKRLLKIGSVSPSDVVFAESFLAQGNQILLGARAAEQTQAAEVLRLITKDPSDPRLKGVDVAPTTAPEHSPQVPNISLEDAAKEAWASRPELQIDQLVLRNDDYNVRATHNALLPSLNLSAEYVSVGLSGNTPGAFIPNGTFTPDLNEPIVDQNGTQATSNGIPIFLGIPNGAFGPTVAGGIGGAYSQIFHNTSPEYAASLNLNLPLRNRSAQAANAQDQLTEREDQVVQQRQKSTIYSDVTKALAAVNLDAAQVDAAVKATQLAQQSYEYEVDKFNLGQADTYFVVEYASILNQAKLAELQSKANYEIALANFNQALGRTLSANHITISSNGLPAGDSFEGTPLIPGTVNGRLFRGGVADGELR